MAGYDYNSRRDFSGVVHALSVTGKLPPEAARLLIDCEEALAKLGCRTSLQLQVVRDEYPDDMTKEAVR